MTTLERVEKKYADLLAKIEAYEVTEVLHWTEEEAEAYHEEHLDEIFHGPNLSRAGLVWDAWKNLKATKKDLENIRKFHEEIEANEAKENTNMKTAEEMIAITKEQYEVAIRAWATDTYLYDLSRMDTEWEPDEGLNKAAHSAHEESELYYELLRKFGLSSEELNDVHNRSLEIISEVTRKMNEANK